VDRRVDSPEQRICEDVPKLAAGLSELTRELVAATVDAAFYAWQLKWVGVWGRRLACCLRTEACKEASGVNCPA
jgi:hypothetical protein